MCIRLLLKSGLLAVLVAGCAPRSVIARQPLGPAECGGYAGSTLVLNGVGWSTESEAEMQEWLSLIDSADVRRMVVHTGAMAHVLYGASGYNRVVEVTLKRGSASEKRFSAPPSPRPVRVGCHAWFWRNRPPAPATADSTRTP